MLISWHRHRELVWRKQLTAAWNSFSTDPWTDVVMVNNGWEWVQLNGTVNHSQFCHLGSWGALQNSKQVVSFTGLQSIKSWFCRGGLAIGLVQFWHVAIQSHWLAQSCPFHARREQHSPTWVRSAKYMATQCNAMQTVSSKLPSTSKWVLLPSRPWGKNVAPSTRPV